MENSQLNGNAEKMCFKTAVVIKFLKAAKQTENFKKTNNPF